MRAQWTLWARCGLALILGVAVQTLAAQPEPVKGGAIPVEVVQDENGFHLLRGGEHYQVRGAGLEFGDMAALAAHGGNSLRTWRTDNGQMTGLEVLDRAAAHGLTVMMCIEIGRERLGFDYDDEAAVADQLAAARREVVKYKDHPALLAWMIGNEVNLSYSNPRVFDAVNDISRMIHDVDGKHPTTTALAGFDAQVVKAVTARAPDLDFLSIQMYGDIVNLEERIRASGYGGPYFVTEWGAVGHWEVGTTAWGAPVEQDSSQKAASYQRAWDLAITRNPDRMLGSYVFLWEQKQERTPTWYGMFLEDGSETEAIDVMHRIWTGMAPENRAPRIESMKLAGMTAFENVTLAPGNLAQARVFVSDPDGDALDYEWRIMRESEAKQEGGDRELVPETLEGRVMIKAPGHVEINAPSEPGPYRLFVYARDGRGSAAHANIPFLVR